MMFDTLTERLRRCRDVQSVADCLLQYGLQLSHTRCGNVQLINWKKGYLEIKAQLGFSDEFLNFFQRVSFADSSACARALRNRNSIVIEDVNADRQFAPCWGILDRAGVRAVQSTPMVSSNGALVGILSTHFPERHQLTDIEMRKIRRASAHVAADALIALQANGQPADTLIRLSRGLLDGSRRAIEHAETALARSL
jgi:GAF domain-containing protein